MEGDKKTADFLENLSFAIDSQVYTDENRKLTATRVIFRTQLRDKALLLYHGLSETRANWQLLETAFLARFAPVARKEVDQTRFLNPEGEALLSILGKEISSTPTVRKNFETC